MFGRRRRRNKKYLAATHQNTWPAKTTKKERLGSDARKYMAGEDDKTRNTWQRRQKCVASDNDETRNTCQQRQKYLASGDGETRNTWQRSQKYLACADDGTRNFWQRRQRYLGGQNDEIGNTWQRHRKNLATEQETTGQGILDSDAKKTLGWRRRRDKTYVAATPKRHGKSRRRDKQYLAATPRIPGNRTGNDETRNIWQRRQKVLRRRRRGDTKNTWQAQTTRQEIFGSDGKKIFAGEDDETRNIRQRR